jgi:hypothetical protein
MSISRVNNNRTKRDNIYEVSISLWKQAIYDAECRLKDAQKRVTELQRSLEIFREKAQEGAPWPGLPNEPATRK